MKANKKTISYGTRRTFHVLVATLLLSFGMYSFAIASTTVGIADSKIMNEEIQVLRTEIAELESDYYTMINKLSVNEALEEGFVIETTVQFARVNEATYVAYND